MRVIRPGMSGDDVQAWELFLRGREFYWLEVDGNYDAESVEATKMWQREHGLTDDGVVGPRTFAAAQALGFDPGFEDTDPSEDGRNWPPKPTFSPLKPEGRVALFGQFQFVPNPSPRNPEAIQITDDWPERNIETVEIAELVGVQGAPAKGKISLHRVAVEPVRKFFKAIDDAGLKSRLLSYGGSWVPRFVRGSRSTLSNHAYGSAIDLNVAWNMLKTIPALKGRKGSVRELVPIAHQFGIYWGGHFERQDGMHFELARTE